MRTHKAIQDQWHFLTACAKELFGKHYWSLSDEHRVKVHLAVNGDGEGYGVLKTAGLLERMPGVRNGSHGGYPKA